MSQKDADLWFIPQHSVDSYENIQELLRKALSYKSHCCESKKKERVIQDTRFTMPVSARYKAKAGRYQLVQYDGAR